ncbi:hypothetical protein [Endozoicomonas atrinae]|uniref:hypothetical protein n=1 Tax=Endozoicomonas atrinae TaxID=1333660 RepID=UPI000A7A9621|nr:hypothetical protein [Endozoicomonas atrinae]
MLRKKSEEACKTVLETGQKVNRPRRQCRYNKSQETRIAIAREKSGRKGRKTISENNSKALLEKRKLEIEEKQRKLDQQKANEEHVAKQMMAVQARLLARPVTSEDVARIRTDLHNIVVSETERARLFLEGKSEWNSNQVRLYGMLLNKVMPDLSQKFTEVQIEHRKVDELSRAELEAIIAEAEVLPNGD